MPIPPWRPCRPPTDDPASPRQTTSMPLLPPAAFAPPAPPAPDQVTFYIEQIQDPAYAVVHEIVDRLRLAVERGNRRCDDSAHLAGLQQQAAMAQVQGRLARHQHQPAALLQHHVGRAYH